MSGSNPLQFTDIEKGFYVHYMNRDCITYEEVYKNVSEIMDSNNPLPLFAKNNASNWST